MEENIDSIQTKCPSCDSSVTATISAESNLLTYLSTLLLVLSLQFYSLFILPFSIPLSKSISLRCPNCKTLIKKKKFSIQSLNDQVFSIQFKNFGLIFSRRYLIIFLLISYSLYFLLTSNLSEPLIISSITWTEYLEDCSAEKIIKNKEKVFEDFSIKYYNKVVSWEGYLMKASLNSGWFQGEHSGILFVKMNPTESEIYPDLVLTMNEEDLERCKFELTKLNRGDKFAFNATLVKAADEETLHHLHGHQVDKRMGSIEIPYEMKSFSRSSARPSVELLSVVDKVKIVSHDHIHVYNSSYNSTLD